MSTTTSTAITSAGTPPAGVRTIPPPVPPDAGGMSQADRAYLALRELVVSLHVAPGEPLDEADLMKRLEVGRTPLREARNRLVVDGLLVTYPRRGTFATDVNLADLALLSDVRAELEGLAAARAATRATAADRERLAALVAPSRMPGQASPPSSKDGVEVDVFAEMRHDTAIHRALWTASHNHFLERACERHHSHSTRIWYLFVDRLAGVTDHVVEQADLVGAVLAGDADTAERLAQDHVRHFEQVVTALL